MSNGVVMALAVSTAAGLSTGIGGLVVYFQKHMGKGFLSLSLGFSAGIMLTVSLSDLLPEAAVVFAQRYGKILGAPLCIVGMLIGIALSFILDTLVPKSSQNLTAPAVSGNGRELRHRGSLSGSVMSTVSGSGRELRRLSIMTALTVLIHNLPEGMATFMGGFTDTRLGISLAIAIALHNIPEGMGGCDAGSTTRRGAK